LNHVSGYKALVVVMLWTYEGEEPKEAVEVIKKIAPGALVIQVPLRGLS
jgi:hypothetical protein